MTARLILKYPDQRLRGYSEYVTPIDYETHLSQWCKDLRDTMIATLGLGLAGPQIGIKKRIFAINAKHLINPSAFLQDPKDGILYFINPIVSLVDDETNDSLEGSLSIPGALYKVKRSPTINLNYMTPQYDRFCVRIVGEDAAIVQHENDYLLGKLFIDKLNHFDKKQLTKLIKLPKKEKTAGELNQLREQRRAKSRATRKKRQQL